MGLTRNKLCDIVDYYFKNADVGLVYNPIKTGNGTDIEPVNPMAVYLKSQIAPIVRDRPGHIAHVFNFVKEQVSTKLGAEITKEELEDQGIEFTQISIRPVTVAPEAEAA